MARGDGRFGKGGSTAAGQQTDRKKEDVRILKNMVKTKTIWYMDMESGNKGSLFEITTKN